MEDLEAIQHSNLKKPSPILKKVIQQLLGHSSPETTKIYTQVSTKSMKEIYNKAHPRSFSKLKN